jgi:hypothetical protein
MRIGAYIRILTTVLVLVLTSSGTRPVEAQVGTAASAALLALTGRQIISEAETAANRLLVETRNIYRSGSREYIACFR